MSGSCRNFRIIVVNHGSTDGTGEGLRNEFPDVIHLPGTTDMWWAGATNAGIRKALEMGAETVMLLNNDCYVETTTIETLLDLQGNAGLALVAPNQRGRQSGRIITGRVTTCFLLGFPVMRLPGGSTYRPGEHRLLDTRLILGGRGVLIPARVFGQAGLFDDERLPHYWSDHDFYLRCRKQGIPLYIASDAVVDVDEETTTLASRLGRMPFPRFIRSLGDRRSHRNLPELAALFRLHYPLPGLYLTGVALNALRYTAVYLSARLLHILGIRR